MIGTSLSLVPKDAYIKSVGGYLDSLHFLKQTHRRRHLTHFLLIYYYRIRFQGSKDSRINSCCSSWG